MMALARVEVRYTGRVQGVGFRMTTRHVAQDFPVTGTVRNLPDGAVEVVAEGERDQVERFLMEVESRFGGHIAGREARWSGAAGGYRAFTIVV